MAENIGPARQELALFMSAHPDLAKLSKADEAKFVELSKAAKMVGRSGQEKAFQAAHAEAIKKVAGDKAKAAGWKKWGVKAKSGHALLHNPDQVAGGHGAIDSLAPLKKPARPGANASDAEWEKFDQAQDKYLEDLSKYVGHSVVNSVIGAGWANKIPELKLEVTKPDNYTAPIYGLWLLRFKLGYAMKKK
jgi:hypothetical protein